MCVTHNPGCSWILSSGNSGEDKFFSGINQLPPGAKISSMDYTPYWPKGLQREYAGGIGRKGSYGQRITNYSPLSIGWENSCQGDYGGKNLYYSMSFVISVPVGTDLGEETFESGNTTVGTNLPGCAPSDYTSTGEGGPPPPSWTTTTYADTLRQQPIWEGFVPYADTFPAPGLSYTGRSPEQWEVLSFSNPNGFAIFVLKGGMSAQHCFEAGAGVTLQPGGTTTAPDIYGVATLHAPIGIAACINNGASVPGAISLNITYRH
jgi:hypothetical protein